MGESFAVLRRAGYTLRTPRNKQHGQMTKPGAVLRQVSGLRQVSKGAESTMQSRNVSGTTSTSARTSSMGAGLFSSKSFSRDDRGQATALIRKQLASMERRTLRPDGKFVRMWDKIVLLTLVWIATVTPVEVSFVPPDKTNWTLFVCSRIVDVLFIFDIIVNFCIPFRKPPKKGGGWVYSSRAIAHNYLRSWFFLDALTAIPVDLILVSLELDPDSLVAKGGRVFRLLKLVRLARLNRITKRWLSRSTIDLSVLELVKFGAMTILTAHWLACIWGFAGRNYSDNTPINLDTWYIESYRHLSWVQKHQLTESSWYELYGVSLYVSLSNIFGGPCEINPANYYEFYLQGFMMLFGSSLWAYIIGSVCGIVATLNPAGEEHRRLVGQLNHYVRDRKCSPELAARLRLYFNETSRARYYEEENQGLMQTMTPQLRGEASLAVAQELFLRVPYLSSPDIERAFLSRAALALSSSIFCPREQVPCVDLTVVTSGLVARRGRLGQTVLAVDAVLNLVALRDTQPAMALTFAQASSIQRTVLDELLEEYPIAKAHVRKFCVRLTLQRVMLRVADHAREHANESKTGPHQVLQSLGSPLTLEEAFEQAKAAFIPHFNADVPPTAAEAKVAAVERKLDALGTRLEQRMDELTNAMHKLLEAKVLGSTALTPTAGDGASGSGIGAVAPSVSTTKDSGHSASSSQADSPTPSYGVPWSPVDRSVLGPTRVSRREIASSPSSPVKDRPVPLQKLARRNKAGAAGSSSKSAAGSTEATPLPSAMSSQPERASSATSPPPPSPVLNDPWGQTERVGACEGGGVCAAGGHEYRRRASIELPLPHGPVTKHTTPTDGGDPAAEKPPPTLSFQLKA